MERNAKQYISFDPMADNLKLDINLNEPNTFTVYFRYNSNTICQRYKTLDIFKNNQKQIINPNYSNNQYEIDLLEMESLDKEISDKYHDYRNILHDDAHLIEVFGINNFQLKKEKWINIIINYVYHEYLKNDLQYKYGGYYIVYEQPKKQYKIIEDLFSVKLYPNYLEGIILCINNYYTLL